MNRFFTEQQRKNLDIILSQLVSAHLEDFNRCDFYNADDFPRVLLHTSEEWEDEMRSSVERVFGKLAEKSKK